jgi:hypothetical protein
MFTVVQSFLNQDEAIIFIQSELGDLYRVFVDELKVSYFDTVPPLV